jgi:hypothetical protein
VKSTRRRKISSSKIDFVKTKNNFVKSQRRALRMVFLFYLSHKTLKSMHISSSEGIGAASASGSTYIAPDFANGIAI